jgi:hypothetical protein
MLIARGFDGVVNSVIGELESGPPGRKPAEDRLRLHQWYQTLDEPSRDRVRELVTHAVHGAVFGCLCLLDGVTGGWPVPGQLSDFAVYLQTYADEQAVRTDSPLSSVRVNPGSKEDEELHDLLNMILAKRSQGDGARE